MARGALAGGGQGRSPHVAPLPPESPLRCSNHPGSIQPSYLLLGSWPCSHSLALAPLQLQGPAGAGSGRAGAAGVPPPQVDQGRRAAIWGWKDWWGQRGDHLGTVQGIKMAGWGQMNTQKLGITAQR